MPDNLKSDLSADCVRRPWPMSDLHYRMVAEVYLEAVEVGDSGRQAVAETWEAKPNTADSWIRRCRQQGYLPKDDARRWRRRPPIPPARIDGDPHGG